MSGAILNSIFKTLGNNFDSFGTLMAKPEFLDDFAKVAMKGGDDVTEFLAKHGDDAAKLMDNPEFATIMNKLADNAPNIKLLDASIGKGLQNADEIGDITKAVDKIFDGSDVAKQISSRLAGTLDNVLSTGANNAQAVQSSGNALLDVADRFIPGKRSAIVAALLTTAVATNELVTGGEGLLFNYVEKINYNAQAGAEAAKNDQIAQRQLQENLTGNSSGAQASIREQDKFFNGMKADFKISVNNSVATLNNDGVIGNDYSQTQIHCLNTNIDGAFETAKNKSGILVSAPDATSEFKKILMNGASDISATCKITQDHKNSLNEHVFDTTNPNSFSSAYPEIFKP